MYFIRITLTICASCLLTMAVSAQEASQTESIPIGTPIIRIFANVHQGLSSGDQSKAFEARRVYLGYKADLSSNFSTEVKVDIGSPEEIFEGARLRRFVRRTGGPMFNCHHIDQISNKIRGNSSRISLLTAT